MATKKKKRKTRSDKGKKRVSYKKATNGRKKNGKKTTAKKTSRKRKKAGSKAAKTRKSRATFFKKAGLPGYKKPGRKKKRSGQIPIKILERRLGELNTIVGERGGAAYSCD